MRIKGMKFAYTIAITLVNVCRAQQVSMNVRTRFLCSGYQTCTPRRLLRYVSTRFLLNFAYKIFSFSTRFAKSTIPEIIGFPKHIKRILILKKSLVITDSTRVNIKLSS